MNVTKQTIIVAPLLGLLVLMNACSNKTKSNNPLPGQKDRLEKIKSMNWLVGKWEMKMNDTISSENWEMKNDSLYTAISMDVVGGKDTIRFEQITIEQRGTDIYYTPLVKGQNDGKPVDFKMTSCEGKNIVFENPEHDFPKKIMYRISGDTLLPSISGPIQGQEMTMEFPMIKVK